MSEESESLEEHMKKLGPKPEFQKKLRYEESGDTLTYFWQNEESYGEPKDATVVLFRSFATDAIVGVQINGAYKAIIGATTE